MHIFEKFWKVSLLWNVLYKITVVSHTVSHHMHHTQSHTICTTHITHTYDPRVTHHDPRATHSHTHTHTHTPSESHSHTQSHTICTTQRLRVIFFLCDSEGVTQSLTPYVRLCVIFFFFVWLLKPHKQHTHALRITQSLTPCAPHRDFVWFLFCVWLWGCHTKSHTTCETLCEFFFFVWLLKSHELHTHPPRITQSLTPYAPHRDFVWLFFFCVCDSESHTTPRHTPSQSRDSWCD